MDPYSGHCIAVHIHGSTEGFCGQSAVHAEASQRSPLFTVPKLQIVIYAAVMSLPPVVGFCAAVELWH